MLVFSQAFWIWGKVVFFGLSINALKLILFKLRKNCVVGPIWKKSEKFFEKSKCWMVLKSIWIWGNVGPFHCCSHSIHHGSPASVLGFGVFGYHDHQWWSSPWPSWSSPWSSGSSWSSPWPSWSMINDHRSSWSTPWPSCSSISWWSNISNLRPAFSRALTAAMVEPFGLVTSSFSWPGCKPVKQNYICCRAIRYTRLQACNKNGHPKDMCHSLALISIDQHQSEPVSRTSLSASTMVCAANIMIMIMNIIITIINMIMNMIISTMIITCFENHPSSPDHCLCS